MLWRHFLTKFGPNFALKSCWGRQTFRSLVGILLRRRCWLGSPSGHVLLPPSLLFFLHFLLVAGSKWQHSPRQMVRENFFLSLHLSSSPFAPPLPPPNFFFFLLLLPSPQLRIHQEDFFFTDVLFSARTTAEYSGTSWWWTWEVPVARSNFSWTFPKFCTNRLTEFDRVLRPIFQLRF